MTQDDSAEQANPPSLRSDKIPSRVIASRVEAADMSKLAASLAEFLQQGNLPSQAFGHRKRLNNS